MRTTLNLGYTETFIGDGQELTLHMMPLSAVEKADLARFSVTARRTKRDYGNVSDPGSVETYEEDHTDGRGLQRFLFSRCVRGWEDVEADGKPLKFTIDNLDMVLGHHPEIHNALSRHILLKNKIMTEAELGRAYGDGNGETGGEAEVEANDSVVRLPTETDENPTPTSGPVPNCS